MAETCETCDWLKTGKLLEAFSGLITVAFGLSGPQCVMATNVFSVITCLMMPFWLGMMKLGGVGKRNGGFEA